MKRLLWFVLLVALMCCAEKAKAQNPAANIKIGTTQVQGGINGDCLKVTSNKLGQGTCGGGGGGSPAGPACAVQFNNSGSFGGNAAFCFDLADLLVKIGGSPITPFAGLYVGPDESTLDPALQGYIGPSSTLFTAIAPDVNPGFGFETQATNDSGTGTYSAILCIVPTMAIVCVASDNDVLLSGSNPLLIAEGIATYFDLTA